MSGLDSAILSEELIEYTKENSKVFPEDFRQDVDDQLVAQIGADAVVVWELGGKIFLRKHTFMADAETATRVKDEIIKLGGPEDCIQKINDDLLQVVELQLAKVEVASGYNPERHLYAIDGKIYVEDDYVWCEIPDELSGDATNDGSKKVFYAEADDQEEFEDEALASSFARESTIVPRGQTFWLNFYDEQTKKTDLIKYEPLVVNNFDLDNPVLRVEVAYRNALCEIESRPTCGWMVLLHDGHFYVPVESIEDPINRETFYYTKIYNSYPIAITSERVTSLVYAEIFNQTFSIGIRYRSGYCANWRQLFFEYLLPPDYLDQITDFYKVTDKPYGTTLPKERFSDYDGFKFHYSDEGEDDDDEFDQGRKV